METVTNWIQLWRDLVEARYQHGGTLPEDETAGRDDRWQERARRYHRKVELRWQKPDIIREFLIDCLKESPDATLLDIGAGTGAWACVLAPYVQTLTALDPSASMLGVLKENLVAAEIKNVDIVQAAWPDVMVAPHDFSLTAHAMYGYPDFPGFIRHMMAVTRKTCFLVLRVSPVNGIMSQAAQHIWGQPYGGPNFQIAYNALLQMGIFPSTIIEDAALWPPRVHPSLEAALDYLKHRLGLGQIDTYDTFLMSLLRQHLTYNGEDYVWSQGARAALIYWPAG